MDPLSFAPADTLARLGVALAVGLLIGLERGWEGRDIAEGARVAGIRTFGVIGLLGGGAAVLVDELGALFVAASLASLGLLATVSYWRNAARQDNLGITTPVAALLTFALGAMAGSGLLLPAAAATVVVALLLSVKTELHELLNRVDRRELIATLRLLLISVVVLPILPNQGFGPLQALNPYQLWLMVVVIAGVSYVGYLAVVLVGDRRGILAAALLGGVVSSTAVAINLGRLAREHPEGLNLFAAGIVGASTVMFPRVLVIAAVFAPVVAWALLWPLVAATVLGAAVSAWFAYRSGTAEAGHPGHRFTPKNPLDLRTAVEFGLLLALIMVLARVAQRWYGDVGLYVLAALSGITDVDPIVLSFSTMAAEGSATIRVAAAGVVVAVAVNSLVKPVMVAMTGGLRLALHTGGALLAAVLAAAAVLAMGAFI